MTAVHLYPNAMMLQVMICRYMRMEAAVQLATLAIVEISWHSSSMLSLRCGILSTPGTKTASLSACDAALTTSTGPLSLQLPRLQQSFFVAAACHERIKLYSVCGG